MTALLLLIAPLSVCAPPQASMLDAVPESAHVLVHCRDVAALRARAERNDWYRLLGSSHGEPLLEGLAGEWYVATHCELDDLLPIARALHGEAVFFDTGTVAGLVTDPSAGRAELAALLRAWLPATDAAARRTVDLGVATVELVAWPDEIDGWTGRAGHFAAYLDHPRALGLYSGDDSAAVMAAVRAAVAGLEGPGPAPLVAAYRDAGGGVAGGLELFFDFTPLVGEAEAAMQRAVEGVLPDPSGLLGLEEGTWLHATADVFPGTRVDCRARLRVPPGTLAAELADTFGPLARTLPADLPHDVWALWALRWDVKAFYHRARAAWEDAGRGDGLAAVDSAVEAGRGMADVDVVVDVLDQLAGDFAYWFVEPEHAAGDGPPDDLAAMRALGLHVGLLDGAAFLAAFEKLFDVGGMERFLELDEVGGADAYLATGDDGFDGGAAFLPRALVAAPTLRVLEAGVAAHTRVTGASLPEGSRMQAAIDESAGACFLTCVELTPLRALLALGAVEGPLLPPLEDGQAGRDPFDSQLVGSARRTSGGFELRLETR